MTITEARGCLRCPACRAPMEHWSSLVACRRGHEYKFRDGYLDLASEPSDDDTRRTFESFGYEWTRFHRIRPEDRHYWEWYFSDVPVDTFADELALDAGCGMGRYSYFTAAHVKELVALDGSDAVLAAAKNLESRSNALVVRADLRDAPLAPQSFGLITCLGVLHHLSDPFEGLRALSDMLAPRGGLLVYVYSRDAGFTFRNLGLDTASLLRRITTKMPHRALRALSAPVAAVLYVGLVLPGLLGERLGLTRLCRLPLATYRRRPLRSLWLDTFDRLSAPLEHRYRWEDLAPWYERLGLDVVTVREDAGLFVFARKPEAV